jgi:drug/metabolite transporter (DMT)-like permease
MIRQGHPQWKVYVCNAVNAAVACLVILLWGGVGLPSGFTLGLGIVFGAVTALGTVTSMKALQTGPMAYSVVIISCSTLITALSGVLFFGESLGWVQGIGIALMLVSFFLAVEQDKEKKKASLTWLGYCFLAFCCSGAVGIMQKVESTYHKDEMSIFLVIAFAMSFLFSLITASLLRVKSRKDGTESTPLIEKAGGWKTLIIPACMVLMGISAGVNNKLNLSLSGALPSAVFFPVVNGGGLVLASLAAILLFRERLTAKQWIGVAFGTASVILLCLPI